MAFSFLITVWFPWHDDNRYGYHGKDTFNNLHTLPSGELLYFVSTMAVIYNKETNNQRHYTGHADDIKWYNNHAFNKIMLLFILWHWMELPLWRQRGHLASMLDSQSSSPRFTFRSGHLLDLLSVVPSSYPQPCL